ncbi:heterokaryon incompatibility protein-domain-containing protein [Xylariales sp. PMI_506]|nr:heterokaryon incompatibility protein-domain-containing protein [Xylariales sp. PMI_506]
MMAQTNEFRHAPLLDDEIRLVTLLPEIVGDDTIRCVVSHVKLSQNPVYECLSYAWGEPSQKTYDIVCNGKDYVIQENLVIALFLLRQGQPRVLWVDQICINQKDTSEKNTQVLRMAAIYRSASQVVLSLGTPSMEIGDGVGFMIDFLESFGKEWHLTENSQFKRAWRTLSSAELHQHFSIPLPEDPGWEGVRHILNQPCFQRTWIVQEVALAKKLKVLFTSGLEMDWDRMVWVRAMIVIRGLCQLVPDHHSLQLLSLLSTTRIFAATNPRDKIYGLLSVATDSRSLDIRPDYSKTICDIYIDVTRRLISQTKSLDVLRHVETFKFDDQLPSWVPDWRSERLEQFPIGKVDELDFNAALDSVISLRDLGDATKLGLQGISIGTISMTTSGPLPEDEESHGYVIGHNLWWTRALAAAGSIYRPTGESLAVALGRTRVGDSDISGANQDAYYSIKVKKDERPRGRFAGLRSQWATMLRQCLYRQLISTRNGYIGLGPLTADLGDSVFLLRGANVPFVLRKVNKDEYRLIGQCYLHGVMYGELLTSLRAHESSVNESGEIWKDICLV